MNTEHLLPGVKLEWREDRLHLGDCVIGKVEPKRWQGKNTESYLGTLIWPHAPFTSTDPGECREWVRGRAVEWLRRAGLAT